MDKQEDNVLNIAGYEFPQTALFRGKTRQVAYSRRFRRAFSSIPRAMRSQLVDDWRRFCKQEISPPLHVSFVPAVGSRAWGIFFSTSSGRTIYAVLRGERVTVVSTYDHSHIRYAGSTAA